MIDLCAVLAKQHHQDQLARAREANLRQLGDELARGLAESYGDGPTPIEPAGSEGEAA